MEEEPEPSVAGDEPEFTVRVEELGGLPHAETLTLEELAELSAEPNVLSILFQTCEIAIPYG